MEGKYVLVTGGSSGLGFEIAKKLLAKGAHVTICSRSEENLKKAATNLNSPNLSTIVCDVTNYSAVESMMSKMQQLDVVINTAGMFLEGNLESFTPERITETVQVNLIGTIFTTKAALPLLKQSQNAFIVNVSSTSGLKGRPNETIYCASKWGVQGFTESLKLDLVNTNIRVVGFYPGGMNTPFFEKANSVRPTETYMNPADVAEIVAYILQEPSNLSIDHIVVNKRAV